MRPGTFDRVSDSELARRRIAPPALTRLGALVFSMRRKRPAPPCVRRVLFLKFGAIGDVILTTPLVRAVRERWPGAQLEYAVGEWSAGALKHNPAIAQVISFPETTTIWRRLRTVMRLVKKLRARRYDVVFVLDRAWQAGVIGRLVGGYTVGFDRLGEGFALDRVVSYGLEPHEAAPHDIATYLALGETLGCSVDNSRMVLTVRPADHEWVRRQMTRLASRQTIVAICPGGARNLHQPMPARRWPAERYGKLAAALLAEGMGVMCVGDEHDNEEARTVCALAPATADFTGTTTLAQAAALLAICKVVVCHDTAMLHIASAVGTPTVALFGPTNPRRKRPLGHEHLTIWKELPCPRCGQSVCHWERRAPHAEAYASMLAISVEEVLQHVWRVVKM